MGNEKWRYPWTVSRIKQKIRHFENGFVDNYIHIFSKMKSVISKLKKFVLQSRVKNFGKQKMTFFTNILPKISTLDLRSVKPRQIIVSKV